MRRALIALIALACACPSGQKDLGPAENTPEPLAEVTAGSAKPALHPGYVCVLTPTHQASIPAPFSTNVLEFLVNVGDVVNKDAVLVRLDDQPLREQLNGARAALTQANVAAGAANATLIKERQAFRAGVSSRANVTDAEYRVQEAGANIQRAKVALDAAKEKLAKTTLSAPIAGRVAFRFVEPGARIEEGRPLLRIISSHGLFVKFAIPADDAGKFAVDDVVKVMIDARGAKVPGTAKVRRISPELDAIAQMIIAEADLIDPPAELQAGLVCRIHPKSQVSEK